MKTQPDTHTPSVFVQRFVRRCFAWAFPEVRQIADVKLLIEQNKDELSRVWRPRRDENTGNLSAYRYALGVCDQMRSDIVALEEIIAAA